MSITPLEYLTATYETMYMVFIALIFTIGFGLIIGIILVGTRENGFIESRRFNLILNIIINISRSIPFIILLILLIPLTRIIAGTSIGTTAAIVPLVFYSIPYMSRLVEGSILEVNTSVYELAKSYGASNFQTITKFILPEALPSLVLNFTTLTIAMIGASAMAGTIGGGGIGDLAITYGYGQFDEVVTIICVVILVVLIQVFQFAGLYINKKIKH